MLLLLSSANAIIITEARPLIKINFSEPVTVSSVEHHLSNLTQDITYLMPAYIGKTDDDKNFTYQPNDNLKEGSYTFTINARDKIGNLGTLQSIQFTIQLPELDIILQQPRYGGVNTTQFDFIINTTREANCRYSSSQVSYEVMTQFDEINNNRIFTKRNFSMGALSQRTIYIRCNDSSKNQIFPLNSAPPKSFKFTYFSQPPDISLSAYPVTLYEPPFKSEIRASSSQEAICKYSLNNENQEYSLMTPAAGYNQANFSNLVAFNTTELNPDQQSHTISVMCENRAGFISEKKTITLNINLNQNLQITNINTPSKTSSSRVYLNITTNLNSQCFYTNNSVSDPDQAISPSPVTQHIKSLGTNMADGTYTYYVKCIKSEENIATATIHFLIDTSPPVIIYVNNTSPLAEYPTKTYYLTKLKGEWLAQDNESGVSSYEYHVIYTQTNEEIASGTTSETSFWIDNLQLNESSVYGYKIKVRAKNNVEIFSSNSTSNIIYLDKSIAPQTCNDGIKNGIEKGTDCGGNCAKGCPNNSSCSDDSDCKSDFCNPDGVCKEPTCSDNFKGPRETDIDCGGECKKKCDAGDGCKKSDDCESGVCDVSKGICDAKVDTCSNNKMDKGETDVDCGSVCSLKGKLCSTGDSCENNDDCVSDYCKDEKCAIKQKDSDNDGITDKDDNCPNDANKDQKDSDKDSIGDVCDNDNDNDGLPDSWEIKYNINNNFNPKDQDSDKNGKSDAEDDYDNDALTNFQEFREQTDPNKADSDGDGYTDSEEVNDNSDPNDKSSTPEGSSSSLFLYILLVFALILFGGGGYYGVKKYRESKEFKSDLTSFKRPESIRVSQLKKPETKPQTQKPSETAKKPAIISAPTRAEIKEKRAKIFDIFGESPKEIKPAVNKPEAKIAETSTPKTKTQETINPPTQKKEVTPLKEKTENVNVFDELTEMGKNRLKKTPKTKKEDVFKELLEISKKPRKIKRKK